MPDETPQHASAGHKLGQLVGDWFEEHFVLPLLQEVAAALKGNLDSRFTARHARGEKVIWQDVDGNQVDYDFVIEIGGTNQERGVPIAFVESFWRRGSRHSKDKARDDDSGKLLPMRDTYPTARFLGIAAAGDFTMPARELIRHRGIDLFYVPKAKIVTAFADGGLVIDYPDRLGEAEKSAVAQEFVAKLTSRRKKAAARRLRNLIGGAAVRGYVNRVRAALSALPQEIRILSRQTSAPVVFASAREAAMFLSCPGFDFGRADESFVYEISYSDGSVFERDVATLDELRVLHSRIEMLIDHVSAL